MNKTTPENTGRKQDGTFNKGTSGNPDGKPKGVKHKATLAVINLLEDEIEALTRKAVEMALEGDTTALKICLDRICPTLKSVLPPIKLDLSLPDSLTDTARILLSATTNGEMSPDTASQLISALASVAKVEEMEQIKHRLIALETAVKAQSK